MIYEEICRISIIVNNVFNICALDSYLTVIFIRFFLKADFQCLCQHCTFTKAVF